VSCASFHRSTNSLRQCNRRRPVEQRADAAHIELQRIEQIPGVVAVSPETWFGGVYKDDKPENWIGQLSADPSIYFDKIFDDATIDPAVNAEWKATRNGFVIGEGAGALVLEELEAARARGAPIYAEVLAYGTSNDGYHMAAPEPEAVGVADMMRAAIDRAGIEPEQVGYINAHGTSTPLGDAAETKAIKDVFGDHAYELAVSSTKSMMGHCFGAAGAIEAQMAALAVHHGKLPPTINYEHPDPVCDLDYVPNEARDADVEVALSNAMGLGGHNACVLVGRVE